MKLIRNLYFNVFCYYTYKKGMHNMQKNINNINKYNFQMTLPETNHIELSIKKTIMKINPNKMRYKKKIFFLHSFF